MSEIITKRIEKQLKITRQPQGKTYVPGFRVAGQYVEKLGLKEGDFVDMVADNGLIIIKKHHNTGRTLAEMVAANPVLSALITAFELVPDEGI